MTRSDLSRRMATFTVMIVVGFFLGTYLDQRFTAPDDEPAVTSSITSSALASDEG